MLHAFLLINAKIASGLLKPLVLIFLTWLWGALLAFRLLPYGLSVTSRPIGQPLADDALHGAGGALHVIYAEPNAIAIAEIELRQIAVQMLLAAMLVDALHAALEDRVVAFDGVGADDDRSASSYADVFLVAVLDGLVARETRSPTSS